MPDAQLPKRLYKYQPLTLQTLSNLTWRTLWFSPPSDFNDPFDCAAAVFDSQVSDEDAESAYQEYRAHSPDHAAFDAKYRPNGTLLATFKDELLRGSQSALADIRTIRRGVACFAERWDDLLMWAHYANGHRGICLEFDTSVEFFTKARRVKYEPTVPTVNAVQVVVERSTERLTEALYLTKSNHWLYEKEWRILHKEERMAYTYPWQSLTGVYLGSALADVHSAMVALVLQGSPTQLYRVSRSNDAFELSAEAVTYKPFDYKAGGLTGVAAGGG